MTGVEMTDIEITIEELLVIYMLNPNAHYDMYIWYEQDDSQSGGPWRNKIYQRVPMQCQCLVVNNSVFLYDCKSQRHPAGSNLIYDRIYIGVWE